MGTTATMTASKQDVTQNLRQDRGRLRRERRSRSEDDISATRGGERGGAGSIEEQEGKEDDDGVFSDGDAESFAPRRFHGDNAVLAAESKNGIDDANDDDARDDNAEARGHRRPHPKEDPVVAHTKIEFV